MNSYKMATNFTRNPIRKHYNTGKNIKSFANIVFTYLLTLFHNIKWQKLYGIFYSSIKSGLRLNLFQTLNIYSEESQGNAEFFSSKIQRRCQQCSRQDRHLQGSSALSHITTNVPPINRKTNSVFCTRYQIEQSCCSAGKTFN